MVNYKLVMAITIVVLAFATLIFYLGNVAKESRLEKAEMLSQSVLDYYRVIDERCRARAQDFIEIQTCIEKSIAIQQIQIDMQEEDFQNFDTRKNESGFVVVINKGKNSMASDDFVLTHNREVVDSGCVIEGSIDPGYTCRLNFGRLCDRGDVLEINYGENRAYLKTC